MELTSNLLGILTVVGTIIISLSVHEAMHAFAGYKLGDTTAQEEGRLSLNPLKHIDPFSTVLLPIITLVVFGVPLLAAKPVPFNPLRVKFDEFGSAIIAFAGPLSNLLMAVVGGFLFGLSRGTVADILEIFTIINVAIFVFNLIPIPPLDGSRVLFAFAPEPLQRVMIQLESYGIVIIFSMIILFPGFTDVLININNSVLNILT